MQDMITESLRWRRREKERKGEKKREKEEIGEK